MNHKTAARIALGAIAGVELFTGLARASRRRELFAAAQARSDATGRPLVVVGDPDAGAWTRFLAREYGCGSVCLDLTGCPSCPVAFAADITAGPVTSVPSDSAVVYVSCVLEYVEDVCAGWAEILRMAGSPENVFLVDVDPMSFTAVLYPGARNVIWREPGSPVLYEAPVTGTRKFVYGAALLGLAAASVV